EQSIDRLFTLRQQQLEIFEAMTTFEEQIVCMRLLTSINIPEEMAFISETNLRLCVDKNDRTKLRNEKRERIASILENYESNIEANEFEYRKELFQFEYDLSHPADSIDNLMSCLEEYLNHRTQKYMRLIRYKEARFRVRLKQRRHLKSSSSSMSASQSISVYPEAIIETSGSLFTHQEFAFLSST
ncbi:unnamed protein product, partial [Didymodactylos carnosus]